MEPDGILLVTCGNVLTRIWTVVANRVPWLSLLLSLISRLNSLRFFSVGLFELGDFCNKIEWFMRVTAENHRRDDEFSSLDLEHYYFLLAFDAVYVLCNSRRPRLGKTIAAGVRFEDSSSPIFLIPVHIVPNVPLATDQSMTVCYPPLHTNFDDIEMFVENIEMNRILGFRHFFVYVYKVGPRVSRAIDRYEREGIINVISWRAFPLVSGSKYPVPKEYTIHYLGQMVAINDCLYRAMNNPSRLVAFHDFDELIIPRQGLSLSATVQRELGAYVAGLSVRCAMFDMLVMDDPLLASNWNDSLPRLTTQLKTNRKATILPHHERSKMIVAADKVITMGIHFIWHYHQYTAKELSPDVALLHHYRPWGRGKNIIDRTAWKYRAELLEGVKKKLALFA